MKKRAVVLGVILLGAVACAQKPPTYKPTELQSLKLQVLQKDAQLAQVNLVAAQTKFQQALTELTNEAKKVKEDNKWPENVQFDPNTVTFSVPPPATVPEVKK